MANKVITVTDPSVVTNDTLSGYNNYSDQDGQLGTTMTPTEATNGKTITLSDGVVHEVTTKPVGTTNGEFSAVVSDAVTVDLSGSTTYGIDIKAASLQSATIPFNPGTSNWKITMNINGAPNFLGSMVVVGNQQSTTTVQGTFQALEGASATQVRLKCNATGTSQISADVTVPTNGDIIIERSGAVMSITSNGVSQTVDCTGYDHDNALDVRYGAFTASASNQDVKMDSLIQQIGATIETFLPTTQSTGATITGDNATVMTLDGGTGTTSDMYFAI